LELKDFPRWLNLGELLPEEVEVFLKGSFNREPLLEKVEEFAMKNKVPILLPSSACFLRFLVSVLKPKRILEIGTGIGYSTLNMLYALNGKCKVITVDSNKGRLKVARSFFSESGFDVKVVNADGLLYLRESIYKGIKFDLIFVDSVKSEYPFFNFKVQSLLAKNGIAIFDNVLFRGYLCRKEIPSRYKRTVNLLRKFLEHVKCYPNFVSCILPIGDGLLLIKRKRLY